MSAGGVIGTAQAMQEVLAHLAGGKKSDDWELIVTNTADRSMSAKIPLPRRAETSIEEHLREHNVEDGSYIVELERVDAGTIAHSVLYRAKARLRRVGALKTRIVIGTPPPSSLVRARRAASKPAATEDPELVQIERETARTHAETARMHAELARRRLEREVQASTPKAEDGISALRAELAALRDSLRPRNELGNVLTALAPVLQGALASMLESSARREGLLLRMVSRDAVAPRAAASEASASPTAAIAEALPLLQSLLELAQNLGGGDKKGTVGEVAELVAALGGLGGGMPGVPAASMLPTQQPQHQPQRDPTMLRVLQWMGAVQRFATDDADPAAAADALRPSFALLPGKLRALLLSDQQLETTVSGLVAWLPSPVHGQLTTAIQQPPVRAWLEAFLDELAGVDDETDDESTTDESDDDGDGEIAELPRPRVVVAPRDGAANAHPQ